MNDLFGGCRKGLQPVFPFVVGKAIAIDIGKYHALTHEGIRFTEWFKRTVTGHLNDFFGISCPAKQTNGLCCPEIGIPFYRGLKRRAGVGLLQPHRGLLKRLGVVLMLKCVNDFMGEGKFMTEVAQ